MGNPTPLTGGYVNNTLVLNMKSDKWWSFFIDLQTTVAKITFHYTSISKMQWGKYW